MSLSKGNIYYAVYNCGHIAGFSIPPQLGDVVLCLRCGDKPTRVVAYYGTWITSCVQCRYTRNYDAAYRDRAFTRSQAHSDRYGHTVRVWQSGISTVTHVVTSGQTQVDILDSPY